VIGLGRGPCDVAVLRAAGVTPGCAARAKPFVLAATILGSSLAFIDGSVVNVALPAIQTSLGLSLAATQWIVNAYMLVLGALILVGGAAGDRFGRRRVFVLGVALFTVASMLCGAAPGAAILIAARVTQGVGGALLVPTSLAVISAAFPGEERGKAIGIWAGFSALTTALGPVLGGWLVDTLSWRAIFFVNLPVALATLALTFWRVPESRDTSSDAAMDWMGALLAVIGLGSLAYGLTAESEHGWSSPLVCGALVLSAAALGAFVAAEARVAAPMMPLRLFRSASFSGANAITLLLYLAVSGAFFFLPFDLIRYQGYSAAAAGAAFLPFTLIMGALSGWSGGLVERYGARKPLIVGPVIAAAGFALLARPGIGESYWTSFFPALCVLGLGMAISVAPLTTAVMAAAEDRYAGAASGINNAVARVAGMLAVALMGAIFVGLYGATLEAGLRPLGLAADIRHAVEASIPRLGDVTLSTPMTGQLRATLEGLMAQSFLHSFRIVMLIAAALALAAAQCAHLTIDRPLRAKPAGVRAAP
jgi:EmrB/QacA subfamily drug resistance transporter